MLMKNNILEVKRNIKKTAELQDTMNQPGYILSGLDHINYTVKSIH